jgi:hypothetical protein
MAAEGSVGKTRTEVPSVTAMASRRGSPKLVAGISRGRELGEVGGIRTHRLAHRVLDERQEMVVEVDDDTVHATTPDAVREWREVEVEFGRARGRAATEHDRQHLCDAGATPSPYPSKLARALPSQQPAGARSPLTDYLRTQYASW